MVTVDKLPGLSFFALSDNFPCLPSREYLYA